MGGISCLVTCRLFIKVKQSHYRPEVPRGFQEVKDKGKAVPLQAWTGPEGSRKLKVKVKQSRYRPGQAQRVPGS